MANACSGVAAGWCPVCGDCSCPRDEDGSWVEHIFWPESDEDAVTRIVLNGVSGSVGIEVEHDPACPLHGPLSAHAEPTP